MKKRSIVWMMTLYSLFFMVSNFVHPITPAFLQSIRCPDYMFGLAFAAMALCNFLASPFWGRVGDKVGYGKSMALGMFGYCVGQALFSMATTSWMILAARCVGGFFACSTMVNSMAYITAYTEDQEKRGKYLSVYAALGSLTTAAGFLIGGLIGDRDMQLVFVVQVILGAAAGLVTLFTLGEAVPPARGAKLQLREINPVSSLRASAKRVTGPMATFLLIVFLSNTATFAHDQSFNYYLRMQLDFPTSYNGLFKAVVGLVGLAANMTINMWIVKKTDIRKAISVVLALCSLSLTAMVMAAGVPMFLAAAMLYYTFSAVFLPILQVLMVKNDNGSSQGEMAGLFNAARSLGMMVGPLLSGFAYGLLPELPFIGAAAAFAISVLLCMANRRQYERQGEPR